MLRRTLSCLAALTMGAAGLALWTASPASGGGAPAVTVDTTVDDGSLNACTGAPNDCSLRGAFEELAEDQDTSLITDITVPAGVYELEDELHVHDLNVNVHGAGVAQTIVTTDTGEDSLIRHVNLHGGDGDITVVLSDMTFEGGTGEQEDSAGGSILGTQGVHLTLLRMHLVDNEIRGDGGAIAFYGNPSNDTLIIEDTTFVGNGATELGGAIHLGDGETAEITNSTFTDNTAAFGGALYVGQFEETDDAEATLTHVTLAGNQAFGFQGDPAGGAIGVGPGSTASVEGSLIEASTEGEGPIAPAAVGDPIDSCFVAEGGDIVSDGHNVVDDTSCDLDEDTDQSDTAGGAQALADNGGPTDTMALLADSPAVDAAGDTCAVDADQRGESRPQDGDDDGTTGCDAGAYELAADPAEPPAARPAAAAPDFTG